jgi:ariadne-1
VEEKKEHDKTVEAKMAKMNLRECPKCGARVERVSGCNLMTCRCGQHFCWLCGGATGFNHTWETIEGHQCGRFNAKGLSELGFEGDGKELPEEVNQRFEFYHRRYDAHVQSCKLEQNLIPVVKKKIEKVIDYESEFFLQWYCHGLEKLFECRKILTWSYIFCFCLYEPEFRCNRTRSEIDSYRALFENYQQGMESAIECLSKVLESHDPITPASSKNLISMIVAVDTRCSGIYDSINEIFQNTDNRISPYKRTTEGTSTLLVKPVMNFMEEIKKERKVEEMLKKQQYDNYDNSLEEVDPEEQKAILQSISKNKK